MGLAKRTGEMMSSIVLKFMTIATAALLLLGCPQRQTSAQKFEALYRAGRTFDAALGVGVTYVSFEGLLQELATQVMIAGDHAHTAQEIRLVEAYRQLLMTYKDSGVVWKHQLDSTKYEWLKGAIYVEPELQPLVTKYKLPTSNHRMDYSHQEYATIPADSAQLIWEVAGGQSKSAVELYLHPPE